MQERGPDRLCTCIQSYARCPTVANCTLRLAPPARLHPPSMADALVLYSVRRDPHCAIGEVCSEAAFEGTCRTDDAIIKRHAVCESH